MIFNETIRDANKMDRYMHLETFCQTLVCRLKKRLLREKK